MLRPSKAKLECRQLDHFLCALALWGLGMVEEITSCFLTSMRLRKRQSFQPLDSSIDYRSGNPLGIERTELIHCVWTLHYVKCCKDVRAQHIIIMVYHFKYLVCFFVFFSGYPSWYQLYIVSDAKFENVHYKHCRSGFLFPTDKTVTTFLLSVWCFTI